MKNYKNIRKEPFLYGFTVKAFFVFVIGFIIGLFAFVNGFSWIKLIVFLGFVFVLYFVCKFLLSNNERTARMMDNKLPKKYSDYE